MKSSVKTVLTVDGPVSGVLFPGGGESPTFPQVRRPSLWSAISGISALAGRVSGSGLWWRFSNRSIECRDKFPVGADPSFSVIKAYDAAFNVPLVGALFANRISYVISPERKILYAYSDSNAEKHIENTHDYCPFVSFDAKKRDRGAYIVRRRASNVWPATKGKRAGARL